MRVAMVSEHASPLAVLGGVDAGGQNVHVAAVAAELGRRGVDVTVYTRREDPDVPHAVVFAPGVTVALVDAGPRRWIPKDEIYPHMHEFAAELEREWAYRPPDLVHAHFWMSGIAALRAGRSVGIPVVQTFHALGTVKRRHQGAKDTSPPEREPEEERLACGVDHIIATCSDELFELVRLGARVDDISVVPCGVDLQLFQPQGPVERRDRWPHRLVAVTRLVERKGLDTLIDALPGLPDAELVVAGGPRRAALDHDPEARRLRARAEALGVGDRVEFRGRVAHDRLPALLRSADAVVCAPWYEPFGIVPVEAMACGVPVVASAVGGMVDTVLDGVTGRHVPPKRPAALVDAVQWLFADPVRADALGGEGARRARHRYGWARIADATLQLYRRLAAANAFAGTRRRMSRR